MCRILLLLCVVIQSGKHAFVVFVFVVVAFVVTVATMAVFSLVLIVAPAAAIHRDYLIMLLY